MARTLDDWLRWQETLHPQAIDLGLERVAAVAARLDLPWPAPATLTVGGTNGKGSSAHLAALIWHEAGYRVGLYTSPHLLRYNERVRIDGAEIDDASLCRAFEAIEAARGGTRLTYFEFGTLAALWCFREAAVDVQVLEVGLGGRLDAVNLVDADVALITSIGIDHTDWLGPDRESIAREKAGIFRAGRPAVIAEPEPPHSLFDSAARIGAGMIRTGVDFRVEPRADGGFDWHGRSGHWTGLPAPGLAGAAQLYNAAGVLAAVEALQARLPTPRAAVARALPQLAVPGRCQRRGRYVFDVAHNAEAAQVLAAQLAALPRARTVLVLGMLADKPHAAFVDALAAGVDALVLLSLPGPRGLPAVQLAARLHTPLHAYCCDNIGQALAQARVLAGHDGRIVVTGSFLTVAAALPIADE
jgi:dihydrofolate synthase / folylpolyglutamate synthase